MGTPLEKLRQILKSRRYGAFIIPSSDDHQSEYVSPCDKRREFITGFTGSYGTAVVTASEALLWTDGRYFLQAEQQLGPEWTLMKEGLPGVPVVEVYLARTLPSRSVVVIDPWVIPINTYRRYDDKFANVLRLDISLQPNCVDLVWGSTRPGPPHSPVIMQPPELTGEDFVSKLEKVRAVIRQDALVLTSLDEIAWFFNLRGSDIEFNPVFMSYAIINNSRVVLFMDAKRLDKEAKAYLQARKVEICPYTALLTECHKLNDELRKGQRHGRRVWLDPIKANLAIFQCFDEYLVVMKESPVCGLKAIKNAVEIVGVKNSHVYDGLACVQFHAWLEEQFQSSPAPRLNEFEAGQAINKFRSQQKGYRGPSFAPISAFGANGACVHYEPDPNTALPLGTNGLFLLDSGGQYQEGTTDITRTVHLGTPSEFEKECFTRVLKGQIALATAVFPSGTPGPILDLLARQSLWEVGLDYEHGTGHGVGCFLNVHEGPHGICNSFHMGPVMQTHLQAGMLVTNEPGVYLEGRFGVRLENVLLCQTACTEHKFQGKQYLQFSTLTLVPYQQKMILTELLTLKERLWIDSYHERVYQELSPLLGEKDKQWLFDNTRALPP